MSKKLLRLMIFAVMTAPMFAYADSAEDMLKRSAPVLSKAVKLEKSRSIVMLGANAKTVLVSDNPRYVVQGQLYDMWSNEPINNQAELTASLQQLPLEKLRKNKPLLETTLYADKPKTLTIFINPFADNTKKVTHILSKYADMYRLNFLFFAETTNKDIKQLLQFACVVTSNNAQQVIEQLKSNTVSLTQQTCEQKTVIESYGLINFLGITTSPTLVASNDVLSVGMPRRLLPWLAKNMR